MAREANPSEKSGKENPPSRLAERVRAELVGIGLLLVAIFLFASLNTFNALDPSFNTSGSGVPKNGAGLLGAYAADMLLQMLGHSAYLIPIGAAVFAVRFMILKPVRYAGWVIAGLTAMLFSLAGFLTLSLGKISFYRDFPLPAGGALGELISSLSVRILNRPGAYVLLGATLLCSMMFTINFSLFDFGERLRHLISMKLQEMRERSILKREQKAKEKSREEVFAPAARVAKRPPAPKIIAEEESGRPKPMVQEAFEFVRVVDGYTLPPPDIFERSDPNHDGPDEESLLMASRLLLKKLSDFGVQGTVETVRPGPVVTMFEFKPADGVKINKIVNLGDDLALALRALSIRIVAPIPGKDTVGVEVPNTEREKVTLGDLIDSADYRTSESKLALALGKDIAGIPVVADLAKMPHLLIAGATGSGKSVAVHAMIASLLVRATPKDVRLLIIDPKMLELSVYDGIPHLLLPVVTESKKAAVSLRWAVAEMERRYRMMAEEKVRNIGSYNKKIEKLLSEPRPKPPPPVEGEDIGIEAPPEPMHLPHIVVVIDELADLMMVASKDVEESIARLAQMARAAGIHLIVATQRPSVDVITGMIKANFPARIAFQVASRVDSRTILDSMGAEALLGGGDMLFMPPGTSKLMRIHGSFVSEGEINELVKYLRKQGRPQYDESILSDAREEGDMDMEGDLDEFYDQAVAFVAESRQASVSMIQRRFKIGYNRAARIIEMMEEEGVVGPSRGAKPREVLARKA